MINTIYFFSFSHVTIMSLETFLSVHSFAFLGNYLLDFYQGTLCIFRLKHWIIFTLYLNVQRSSEKPASYQRRFWQSQRKVYHRKSTNKMKNNYLTVSLLLVSASKPPNAKLIKFPELHYFPSCSHARPNKFAPVKQQIRRFRLSRYSHWLLRK